MAKKQKITTTRRWQIIEKTKVLKENKILETRRTTNTDFTFRSEHHTTSTRRLKAICLLLLERILKLEIADANLNSKVKEYIRKIKTNQDIYEFKDAEILFFDIGYLSECVKSIPNNFNSSPMRSKSKKKYSSLVENIKLLEQLVKDFTGCAALYYGWQGVLKNVTSPELRTEIDEYVLGIYDFGRSMALREVEPYGTRIYSGIKSKVGGNKGGNKTTEKKKKEYEPKYHKAHKWIIERKAKGSGKSISNLIKDYEFQTRDTKDFISYRSMMDHLDINEMQNEIKRLKKK